MALRVRFCTSRIRRYPLVAVALGQCRGFHHCFGAVCTGGRVPTRIGASSWYSIEPGGIAVRRLWLPFGIQLVFLPPYLPQLQRMSSVSGRSPTRLSPIAASRRWMSCVAGTSTTLCCPSKQSNLYPSRHALPTFGLPRSPKGDLTASSPIFQ
jgi:hypothetical protein